jgi:GntR family transcriptional repressor for pyruvate dehydrogenase complex
LAELRMLANQFPRPAESAEEEKEQHIASLAFHSKLSDFGKNKLLGFIIGFMSQILTELTLYKKLYEPPNFELWSKGREHQLQLIDALDRGDTTKAREIMTSHMQIAETLMKQQEAQIVRRFIAE